jgi:hypothetical protein
VDFVLGLRTLVQRPDGVWPLDVERLKFETPCALRESVKAPEDDMLSLSKNNDPPNLCTQCSVFVTTNPRQLKDVIGDEFDFDNVADGSHPWLSSFDRRWIRARL